MHWLLKDAHYAMSPPDLAIRCALAVRLGGTPVREALAGGCLLVLVPRPLCRLSAESRAPMACCGQVPVSFWVLES